MTAYDKLVRRPAEVVDLLITLVTLPLVTVAAILGAVQWWLPLAVLVYLATFGSTLRRFVRRVLDSARPAPPQ